jgi:Ala-tRNA(Pro) deacylase
MPASPQDLFAFLDDLAIAHETVAHPPVFTVEESKALRGQLPGGHTKNLFVRDRKGRLFLIVALEDSAIDLKRVHEALGAQGRVSFGSAERLIEVWGVEPGSVTPFGAINDRAGLVTVALEARMMNCARLNFHPLVNTRTTGLSSADLVRFLEATGHRPLLVELPAPA